MKSVFPAAFVSAILTVGPVTAGADNRVYVCPEQGEGCTFAGEGALQQAVDAASAGTHIVLREGRYHPTSYRDIPFSDEGERLSVRGFVAIQDKNITLSAEQGAVIDGGAGVYSSAFVVKNSTVVFEGLTVEGFRAAEKEDSIYDGHGIFIIDSNAEIKDVAITGVEKMALTGRGTSKLQVSRLRIGDSHLGIWLEEDAVLTLENSILQGSESAGLAAYDRSNSLVVNSEVSNNLDDGIYATGTAQICVTNSVISGNKPYGIRAVEDGSVKYDYSAFFGNEEPVYHSEDDGFSFAGEGNVVGAKIVAGNGNPEVSAKAGQLSSIGVMDTELAYSLSCQIETIR